MVNACESGVDSVVGGSGEQVLSFVVVGVDRLENIVLKAILKHVSFGNTVVWDIRLTSRWWAARAAVGVETRAGVRAAPAIAVDVDVAGFAAVAVTVPGTGARTYLEEGFCVH